MKLFSAKRYLQGKQLVCDNVVIDPGLIANVNVCLSEQVITFDYDHSECGCPLDLPFGAMQARFIVRYTPYDIHMSALIEVGDELDEVGKELNVDYEKLIAQGEIEFYARMTQEEKLSLLCALFSMATLEV